MPIMAEVESTSEALQASTKKAEASKVVTDTTPPLPVSSETSPYIFGRFTYYQVTAFTLGAIVIFVVAAPQTYRLLRLR